MRRRHKNILSFLVLLAFVFPAGCTTLSGGAEGNRKPAIADRLQDLERQLKRETWNKVRVFFDPGYYGGYEELRRRVEERWQDEDLVAMQFMVDKVLEADGLLNATVRWHMSYLDSRGRPRTRSGESEILLRPAGDSFRIVHIKGDSFL